MPPRRSREALEEEIRNLREVYHANLNWWCVYSYYFGYYFRLQMQALESQVPPDCCSGC